MTATAQPWHAEDRRRRPQRQVFLALMHNILYTEDSFLLTMI
jgi:hypothetical protein